MASQEVQGPIEAGTGSGHGAPRTQKSRRCELSVVIPVLNERDNITALLPRLRTILAGLGCTHEILVVDGGSTDGTAEAAAGDGVRVLRQSSPGYGGALREGFAAATGRHVLTLDADLSHDPDFVHKLWRQRERADVVIASRYVRGGVAYMPLHRKLLSGILNRFFAIGLELPVRDLSSGFRLYRATVLDGLRFEGVNFDVLEEILVKAHADGWTILEVPFTYHPRERGTSNARILAFGIDLLKAFIRLRRLRASIESADYDERAFYSIIPLQRHWQRRRHHIITRMTRSAGRTLDVGCGSSVILQSLNDAVGLDILANKLRFMRRYGVPLVQGSVVALPVRDEAFDCVVCSQVIEHIPEDPAILRELMRVLRPGGLLVLGTPDYATIGWRTIEPLYGIFAPGGGYEHEHITHYTRASLTEAAERCGLTLIETAYVFRSELILALRKPAVAAAPTLESLAAAS